MSDRLFNLGFSFVSLIGSKSMEQTFLITKNCNLIRRKKERVREREDDES